MNNTKYKIGDIIILRKPSKKKLDEWSNTWVIHMDKYVGQEMRIEAIYKNNIALSPGFWKYPPCVLEPSNEQLLFSFMLED